LCKSSAVLLRRVAMTFRRVILLLAIGIAIGLIVFRRL
jgi:hypothetical protein